MQKIEYKMFNTIFIHKHQYTMTECITIFYSNIFNKPYLINICKYDAKHVALSIHCVKCHIKNLPFNVKNVDIKCYFQKVEKLPYGAIITKIRFCQYDYHE